MVGRPLTPEERALWARLIATVEPLERRRPKPSPASAERAASPPAVPSAPLRPEPLKPASLKPAPLKKVKGRVPPPRPAMVPTAPASASAPPRGLDGHWNRRIQRGATVPDAVIDLHDMTLSHAYGRLDASLELAIHAGQRVLLLITGRPRAHDRATGEGRGGIRAAVHDWLAASRHARHIADVRNAHPRHGGAGALYIILRRQN